MEKLEVKGFNKQLLAAMKYLAKVKPYKYKFVHEGTVFKLQELTEIWYWEFCSDEWVTIVKVEI